MLRSARHKAVLANALSGLSNTPSRFLGALRGEKFQQAEKWNREARRLMRQQAHEVLKDRRERNVWAKFRGWEPVTEKLQLRDKLDPKILDARETAQAFASEGLMDAAGAYGALGLTGLGAGLHLREKTAAALVANWRRRNVL